MDTRNLFTHKTLAIAIAVALSLSAGLGNDPPDPGLSWMSAAYAEEGGGSGHKGAGHEGGGHSGGQQSGQGAGVGKGQAGEGRRGGKDLSQILSDDGDDDSDRPPWAQHPGNEGKPGGGNHGGNTKKGVDYGDLLSIVRNDDGTPVLIGGYPVVILSNGETYPLAENDGELPANLANLAIEVELGRLNVARSPTKVLDHSLVEALSKLDGITISTLEELIAATDPSGRLITTDGATVDSPLENLALYEALLTAPVNDEGFVVVTVVNNHEGADETYTLTVQQDLLLPLAASAIAAASDKTGALTADDVGYISSFIGVDDELASLVGSYTYEPADYWNQTVTVLVKQPDGSYLPTEVNLLETVDFNPVANTISLDGDGTIDAPDGDGFDVFVQQADDAVQVIEFVHDYEVPE